MEPHVELIDVDIPIVDNVKDAWDDIKTTLASVKKIEDELNTADSWFEISRQLDQLRDRLLRRSRHDKQVPGWSQAFDGKTFHGRTRQTAGKIADIHKFLTGSPGAPVNLLPQTGWAALYVLAVGFKDHPGELVVAINKGEIHPDMTKREAMALVKANFPPAEPKASKKKADAKPKAKATEKDTEDTQEESTSKTRMDSLDDIRKVYKEKAGVLIPSERKEEVRTLAEELKVSLGEMPPTVDLNTSIEQISLLTKALSNTQRVEILCDIIDAVGVNNIDVNRAYNKRLADRDELKDPFAKKVKK
jgi:hypothetical protein